MKQINSHDFESVYKKLGINVNKLGCLMLDVSVKNIPSPDQDLLYFSKDPEMFWIQGFVAGKNPHVTLLYGFLESAEKYKPYIDEVLKGWSLDTVKISDVTFFESPLEKEPYYCIVAEIEVSPQLAEGHARLQLLPHIDTFVDYKAHLTLAYIKKNDAIRDKVINHYKNVVKLPGRWILVRGLNYGGDENES